MPGCDMKERAGTLRKLTCVVSDSSTWLAYLPKTARESKREVQNNSREQEVFEPHLKSEVHNHRRIVQAAVTARLPVTSSALNAASCVLFARRRASSDSASCARGGE